MPRLDPQALVRHLDTLHRAAWALCGSREDAEDLVQELCARVLAKPRRVAGAELAHLMPTLPHTSPDPRRGAHHACPPSGRAGARRPRAGVEIELGSAVDPRADPRPEEAAETQE